ncbi:MAG: hypothetical protein AB7N65_16245 [Vicinamibacterales bacterium]
MTIPADIAAIIIVPGRARTTTVSAEGRASTSVRLSRRMDDFAAGMAQRLGIPVTVEDERPSLDALETVVLCRADVLDDLVQTAPAGLRRVVGLELNRGSAMQQCETLMLAGAVETLDYLAWLQGPPSAPGVIGRTELAAPLGAVIDRRMPQRGPRYARLVRSGSDLPSLLADYLVLYASAGLTRP